MRRIKDALFGGAKSTVFWVMVALIVLWALFPVVWLILNSFKSLVDVFAIPPKIVFNPTLVNYQNVFFSKKIQLFFINSVIIASSATVASLIIGVPGAYSLAQYKYRGRKSLGFFILCIRIAPPIMSLFPLYIIFNQIHLVGSRLSIIIMYIVMGLPLSVWIMRIFFADLSSELREAAIIDGCSELQAFLYVMLPLVRAGLSTAGILCFIQCYDEYLYALVLSNQGSQTLPVAISSFMTYQGIEWGPISAAGVLVMIPMIVFGLSVQKYFVKGMTLGAVKG
jgi:multiple sugar transport system permease protein